MNQIIDQVLNTMLNSEDNNFRLAKQQNILDLLERDELLILERSWPHKRVNMVEFIKIMISIVHHKPSELLYLVMGLIELFKDIVASSQQNELALSDVTSFVCQNDPGTNMLVPQQIIPEPKKFRLNKQRVREIDMDAPKVIGFSDEDICHIVPNQITTDSIRHHNNVVQNGFYCKKSIITLDSLDCKLNVYNSQAELTNTIKISQIDDKETIILGFTWSDRQQRLGMTLKSHQLCFYESDYKSNRIFPTVLASQEYQSNIWYLENQNKWLTTDSTFRLFEWDLQTEQVINCFQSKILQGQIIECVEVVHLKMIATASLDKQILVWDLTTKDVKINISLKEQGGVHSLIYSYYYQIFLSCGYSTNINVYEVNAKFHDVSIIGKLQGHTSMLTALRMIGKSPVLVSGDDQGNLRLWDVRNFSCLQCLNFGKKTMITKILDMSDIRQICFIGSRVNLLKLDLRKKDVIENYAVKMEFDQQRDQLLIASKKNILYLDIHTGRIKSLLNGLLEDIEDEITQFRPLNYFNKFILCDQKGNMKIYQSNGEFQSYLKGHSDVLQLKLDILNKLIISSGQDEINIQRMNGELLREITPFKSQLIEISVHHSLLLASNHNLLHIFDYEFVRVLQILEFNADISALLFIANYPIFAVSLSNGKVLFINFQIKEHSSVQCSVYQTYDTGNNNFMTEDAEQEYVNKMILSVKELEVVFSTTEGNIMRLELKLDMQPTPPVHEKINYNPTRKCKEAPLPLETVKILSDQPSLVHMHMFNASKKAIITLNFIQLDTRMIIISVIDGNIKIFDMIGSLVASFNINHPLPIKWEVKYTKSGELRKRIVYGFKVIDILRKQSKTEKEAETYSLTDSIQIAKLSPLKLPQLENVILMRDEYSPRDLQFDKIRHLYQNEIQGPTLKQMEAQRRLLEVQNMFKNDVRDPILEQLIKQRELERQKAVDRAAFQNFLDYEFREKSMHHSKSQNIEYLQKLSNGLDRSELPLKQYLVVNPSTQQTQIDKSHQKKKSFNSDFYKYAASKNYLQDNTNFESFNSQSTFKPTFFSKNPNQVSQIKSMISNDQTWQGMHRKQQKDLSNVLHSLNMKVKHSKNSTGDQILKDITKSDITFEDQLDEFTKKHK